MTANFIEKGIGTRGPVGTTKLQYLPETLEGREMGLDIQSNVLDRVQLFDLENYIQDNLGEGAAGAGPQIDVELGEPCEVLVADMDMRGFTSFSEQAHVESPYICSLMSAFYQVALNAFGRFPADITKFAGDGILSIWRTSPNERDIAVDSVIKGIIKINRDWKKVRTNPHFTHGAPDLIGTSIAFGQASRMKVQMGVDFIGRPINLAARLCGTAPGNKLLIDRSVPSLPEGLNLEEFSVQIKSFGDYKVWIMDCLE